jgi:hypothetical protein
MREEVTLDYYDNMDTVFARLAMEREICVKT